MTAGGQSVGEGSSKHLAAGTQSPETVKNMWSPGLYEVFSANVVSEIVQSSSIEEVQTEPGMILVDPGSDTDFIRNGFAEQLGLQG